MNAGSVVIASGGSLTLNGTFSGNDVVFDGPGSLALQQPQSFAGTTRIRGFGDGDQIDLYSIARGAPLALANGILSAGTATTLPLAGSYGLGNFIGESIGGGPEIIAFAPAGEPSGIVQPDISAPGSASVAQGATLSLNDVSVTGFGNTSNILSVTAESGTLFMDGASGSGSHTVTVQSATADQIAADLATLAYVPAAGTSSDVVRITAVPPAQVTTTRAIPIAITTGGGPTLTEPASATISANSKVAVGGELRRQLRAEQSGLAVPGDPRQHRHAGRDRRCPAMRIPGSGTDGFAVQADYVDVNAILAGLRYAAGPTAGTDTITFDIWNQAGVETTATTSVTIDPPAIAAASPLTTTHSAAGTMPTNPTHLMIVLPPTT